jgi:hypothetical protein
MASTAQAKEDAAKLRASYDPGNPEVIGRRRKLFEDIARNRTPESDIAMQKIAKMFADDDVID